MGFLTLTKLLRARNRATTDWLAWLLVCVTVVARTRFWGGWSNWDCRRLQCTTCIWLVVPQTRTCQRSCQRQSGPAGPAGRLYRLCQSKLPGLHPYSKRMRTEKGSNPLSSWLAPLLPASWIQSKALHLKKREAASLVGYGTVVSMFCNTVGEASTLKQLLLLWGCAEAAFYVYQKWRYAASCSGSLQLPAQN